MTEDEAKTKWCCGPKVVADAMLSLRLMQKKPPEPNPENAVGLCIGSACMAWRILRVPEHYAHGSFKVTIGPEGEIAPLDQKPAQGFCGLAGHP